MSWTLWSREDAATDLLRANEQVCLMVGQDPTATAPSKVNALVVDNTGAAKVSGTVTAGPYLPATSGATPTQQQGTTGCLTQDYTYEIRAGKTIKFHSLQSGVSVSVASGAGEAVLATGKAVVFTDLGTDLSTVTTMRATLAASNAAGLVRIDLGTAIAADTWNHLLTLADTALWVPGTIPANLQCRLGSDGAVWPVSLVEGWQYRSAAAEACASVLATPGTILRGMVYNDGGAPAYLQFHNLAAAPGGGVAPAFVLGEIAAGDTVPWPTEVHGSVGLQVALSSTRDTYTAYAHAHCLLWVE